MQLERKLITNPHTRPALRSDAYMLKEVRGIVIHYTANYNKGANADAHYRYFQNGAPDNNGKPRAASAHWMVDDLKALQIIPCNEVAFHVGDPVKPGYNPGIRARLTPAKKTPNYTTIGIEICVNSDGNLQGAIHNAKMLSTWLCVAYGLDPERDIVRHYDVTGKKCPLFFIGEDGTKDFEQFKQDVLYAAETYHINGAKSGMVTAPQLNVGSGPGIEYPVQYTLNKGERVCVLETGINGTWGMINTPYLRQYVNTRFLELS